MAMTNEIPNLLTARWTEPKLDWDINSRFNIEDYNRILNNIYYLENVIVNLVGDFEVEEMGDDITLYTTFWKSDNFNAFEKNVEIVNGKMGNYNIGKTVTFYDNGLFIDYKELNRLERAISIVYNLCYNWSFGQRRLGFVLGRYKAIKV